VPHDLTPNEEAVLKRADVEDIHKAAAIEDARKNPLYQREALDNFAPKAVELTREFEHLNPEQRKAKIVELMNQFNKEQGIPPVKVEFVPAERMSADGFYGNGVLEVSEKALAGDPVELMKLLYHENVHNRQDLINIRRCADLAEDKLGRPIGRPPTSEDLQAIRKIYEEKNLGPLSKEHLEQSLEYRKGQRLDEAQTRLADRQIQYWAQETGPIQYYWQNINDLRDVYSPYLHEQPRELLKGLAADDGTLKHYLFGPEGNLSKQEQQQLQEFIKAAKDGKPFDEKQAQELCQRLMNRNSEQLEAFARAMDKDYVNNPNEMEAWLIQEKLHSRMNEVSGEAPTRSEVASTRRPAPVSEDPPTLDRPTMRRGPAPVSEDPATLDLPTRKREVPPPGEQIPRTMRGSELDPNRAPREKPASGDEPIPPTKKSPEPAPGKPVEKPPAPKTPEQPATPLRKPDPLPDGIEPVPPTKRSPGQAAMLGDLGGLDQPLEPADIATALAKAQDAIEQPPINLKEIKVDSVNNPSLAQEAIKRQLRKLLEDAEAGG
jgi:hypothetical protein